MENIAMKKFTYDHASSYKGRGKSLASSRVARAQRASEKRHVSRMDEIAKRRRMPLTSIADENVVDVEDKETNDCAKTNTSQAQLSRKEKLLKWREERKLKIVNAGKEKKSFVVRHVKYDQEASLFAMKKSSLVVTEKGGNLISTNKPGKNFDSAKRVTRASARIAQQSNNNVSKPSNLAVKQTKSKDTEKQQEKLALHQGEGTKTTRQSARLKAAASKGSSQSAKATQKAKDTVKTRSQSKTRQDDSLCQSSSSELEELSDAVKSLNPIHPSEEPTFPAFDNIKNTVSVGRGSAEGVQRNQMSTQAEIQSFAPPDFKFKAPEGVNTFTYFSKTFKFNPLSPNSAANFMFPSPSSLFSQEKPSDIYTHEGDCQAEKGQFCLNVANHPKEGKHCEKELSKGEHEMCGSTSLQAQGNGSKTVLDGQHNPLSSENKQDTEMQSNLVEDAGKGIEEEDKPGDTSSEHHDAMYFRGLVKKESERLNEICVKWEKINDEEPGLKEEDRGQIRTTIGQAQLLIDQRFRQFSGLIDLSEDKQAEKQATASDLQGFWDMIYFQVDDINAKFDALEKLKANNWKEEVKKVKKASGKAVKKPLPGEDSNATSKETTKAAASKNRIQQMRMAMKAKMAAERAKLKSEKAHKEEETFVTILTPVKRSKQDDGTEEVVLTPVRRSTRKTPQKLSTCKSTPVVVTTPKKISDSSRGLRLTPDMTVALPNDEAVFCITEANPGAQGAGSEEKMDCEVDHQPHPTLKSASKSRKTSCKVTFQSPMDVDSNYDCTPEVGATVTEAECGFEAERPLNEAVPTGKKKRSTPPRFLARKCRSRAGTPYNAERSVKRTSEVEQGEDVSTDGQTESDEPDSSDAAPRRDSTASLAIAVSSPVSALRRSTRRTPSKYRDTSPLDARSNGQGNSSTDVSVKLFCEKESERKSEVNAVEMGNFSKYLCPSFSDEDEEKTAPVSSELGAEDTFASEQVESNESVPNVNHTKLTPEEHPVKSAATVNEPRPGRTPIHLLQYLSDVDTPSPNSRQITPMPKTTLYISPSGTVKTPGLQYSSSLASPENVVCRFPGKNEAAALVRFSPVAGKEGQSFPTPPVEVPTLKLDDSPVNSEKRRDSVFFAPPYAAEVKAQANLMSFSPVVEVDEEE